MNKRLVSLCLLLSAITIIIVILEFVIVNVYKYNKYGYNENNKVLISDYKVKYNIENIIANYYDIIRLEDKSEFEKVFIRSSNIKNEDITRIKKIYGLQYYEYDLIIDNIYCLSNEKAIYSCEYSLDYTSNVMSEGADVVLGTEKQPVTYKNKIIIKLIENNKYKVLYSKFDLGGGHYYEK